MTCNISKLKKRKLSEGPRLLIIPLFSFESRKVYKINLNCSQKGIKGYILKLTRYIPKFTPVHEQVIEMQTIIKFTNQFAYSFTHVDTRVLNKGSQYDLSRGKIVFDFA